MDLLQTILALLCGSLVGFTLGLIGGGGSIMATPLLLYVVGLPPHEAIGTGALAVSVNAFANFAGHARAGNVRWRSAGIFALVGALGAALGSLLGKAFDGRRLLFLFALLMVAIGVLVLRGAHRTAARASARSCADPPGVAHLAAHVALSPATAGSVPAHRPAPTAPRDRLALVVPVAFSTGALAGFFGIGGGFLIVPGLLASTGMPMILAVGSSLLAVGSFGLTTTVNYAASGLVDWPVAAEYIAGGLVGGWVGMQLAVRLANRQAALARIFATLVFAVAVYMLWRNLGVLRAG